MPGAITFCGKQGALLHALRSQREHEAVLLLAAFSKTGRCAASFLPSSTQNTRRAVRFASTTSHGSSRNLWHVECLGRL